MKKMLIYSLCAVSVLAVYQNRYRLMNSVLSQPGSDGHSFISF